MCDSSDVWAESFQTSSPTWAARDIHAAGIIDTCVNDGFEEEIEDTSSLPWPSILLVEVTVTHGIDEEKRRRIRELNLATLEIDLSLLGGRITREDLRNLIVDQTVGKRWVHHPVFPNQAAAAQHSTRRASGDALPPPRAAHRIETSTVARRAGLTLGTLLPRSRDEVSMTKTYSSGAHSENTKATGRSPSCSARKAARGRKLPRRQKPWQRMVCLARPMPSCSMNQD